MLSNLSRLGIDYNLKPKLSLSEIQRQLQDYNELPLNIYLEKYYSKISAYNEDVWSKIMSKLINPVYTNNLDDLVYVFGYTSKNSYSLNEQNRLYNELKSEQHLDEDLKKFIGFMGGTGFFKEYNITLEDWFNSYYWTRPDIAGNVEYKLNFTIKALLSIPSGLNYLKEILPQLNFWNRS